MSVARCVVLALGAVALTACKNVPDSGSGDAPSSGSATAPASGEPSNATRKTGRITVRQWPIVELDGKEMRAAPGARIFTPQNMMVTANAVPAGARVRYELDSNGNIRTLWLLASDAAGDDANDRVRRP